MLKNKGLSPQIRWHERRLKNGQNTIYLPRQDYGISDRMNWNGDRMGNYLTLIMV